MTTQFKPKFMPLGIGSMPFKDVDHAIDVTLSRMEKGAPTWPQLPACDPRERMERQYSEGMPNIVIDEAKGRIFFDTETDYCEKFGAFYENYLQAMDPDSGNGDCSSMAISPEYSRGLYALEARLKARKGTPFPFVKVQVTGPCTFALSIVDENKRLIYHHKEFRDMITKAIAMKCRWMIQKFKPYAEKVICFLDEPILSAFGSSTYVTVNSSDVIGMLKEVIEGINTEEAISGVHCCGNTEWPILMDAGVDVIRFDAFQYAYTLALYTEQVKAYFARGGIFACGVIPTSPEIRNQSLETLEAKLDEGIARIASLGIDKTKIAEQSILTPACGTGSMAVEDAERVYEFLQKLPVRMQAKFNF